MSRHFSDLDSILNLIPWRLFRRLFLDKLIAAHKQLQFFGNHVPLADAQAFAAYLASLRKAEWVVYSKRPFGGPEAVLAYLSRYTHRVAISNSRLVAFATPVSPSDGRTTGSKAATDTS